MNNTTYIPHYINLRIVKNRIQCVQFYNYKRFFGIYHKFNVILCIFEIMILKNTYKIDFYFGFFSSLLRFKVSTSILSKIKVSKFKLSRYII